MPNEESEDSFPRIGRGAFNRNLCPHCHLFSAPGEEDVSKYGHDLRGICNDEISGMHALTCDYRDLSQMGAAKEQKRCETGRGVRPPPRKHGPLPPGALGNRKFVDLEHGGYRPNLCRKCPRFRLPTEEESVKYGPTLKGVCRSETRRMPLRYLIYDLNKMTRAVANKDRGRCWTIRHMEQVRAKGRDWYRLHRSEWLERHQKWQKTSGWKGRSLSPKLRFEVLQRDGFRCVYCGRGAPEVALEVDHVRPVADGGKSDKDNLVSACSECNAGKKVVHAEIERRTPRGLDR